MYLHIGNNKIIRERDIVGIFDADTATVSASTKKYLTLAQSKGKLTTVTDDIPKSFIVTSDGSIYIAQISPAALVGRSKKALNQQPRI